MHVFEEDRGLASWGKATKTSGAAKNAPEKSLTCLLMHPQVARLGNGQLVPKYQTMRVGHGYRLGLAIPTMAAARLKQRTPAEAWRSRLPEKFLQASNSRPIDAGKSASAFPPGFPHEE